MKNLLFSIILLTVSISLNAGIISGYERACNNNSGGNCHALGRLYEIGGGTLGGKFIQVQKDYKIASMYYRKACDAGDDFGCNEIGYMYQTGKGVTQNIQKAKDAYKKSCKLGNGSGCASSKSLDDKY